MVENLFCSIFSSHLHFGTLFFAFYMAKWFLLIIMLAAVIFHSSSISVTFVVGFTAGPSKELGGWKERILFLFLFFSPVTESAKAKMSLKVALILQKMPRKPRRRRQRPVSFSPFGRSMAFLYPTKKMKHQILDSVIKDKSARSTSGCSKISTCPSRI